MKVKISNTAITKETIVKRKHKIPSIKILEAKREAKYKHNSPKLKYNKLNSSKKTFVLPRSGGAEGSGDIEGYIPPKK